jgi:hypothetical protein
MKTLIFKIAVMLLIVTGSISSCRERNEADKPLPALKGTEWKLERIWYEESRFFREPKIDCEDCYTLVFETDTEAYGFLPDESIRLIITDNKARSKVPDNITGKGGCDSCYYDAGVVGDGTYNDLFFHHYQIAFIGVQFHYSITDTEMRLYFPEPVGIADPAFPGENPVVPTTNSYLLYKKVK